MDTTVVGDNIHHDVGGVQKTRALKFMTIIITSVVH